MDNWKPTTFWIIEDGVLVCYTREGECLRCGECCRGRRIVYRRFVSPIGEDDGQDEDTIWPEYEGWSVFYAQGTWWYYCTREITPEDGKQCEVLGSDNTCLKWEDPKDFKPICRYWPYHPKDLEEFPDCGFSFRKEGPDETTR